MTLGPPRIAPYHRIPYVEWAAKKKDGWWRRTWPKDSSQVAVMPSRPAGRKRTDWKPLLEAVEAQKKLKPNWEEELKALHVVAIGGEMTGLRLIVPEVQVRPNLERRIICAIGQMITEEDVRVAFESIIGLSGDPAKTGTCINGCVI